MSTAAAAMTASSQGLSDSQLMTLVDCRAETPRAKIDERRDDQGGASGDDQRAGNALAGKPDRYTPRDHGDADPEVHQRKGEPMERK